MIVERVAALKRQLDEVHEQLGRRSGQRVRFEFLLDQMWDVFTVEADPVVSMTDSFALDDNLDTGNSAAPAYPPFHRAAMAAFADSGALRQYHGPWPIEGLEDAIKDFFEAYALLDAADRDAVGVAVGAGTVQLWDSLCRVLVRRSGDVILVPAVGYGFFIPQVERAGGRCCVVQPDDTGKVTAGALGDYVDDISARLCEAWSAAAAHRVICYSTDLRKLGELDVEQPADEPLEALGPMLRGLRRPDEIDEVIGHFVADHLFAGDARAAQAARALPYPAFPSPPRVVAHLHIDPAVAGVRYTREEVDALCDVAAAWDISLVQDVAYHSMLLSLEDVHSAVGRGARTFFLLGLSKPFSIADCRAGILVCGRADARAALRSIENTVGWVPTYVQQGLLALFTSDRTVLSGYLADVNTGDDGLERKRELALACLEGMDSSCLPSEERVRCSAAMKTALMTELDQEAVRRFCEQGLRRWLSVEHAPAAGFFVILDCGPLLERGEIGGLPITCSFDVFAVLARLAGVRTIPQEAMAVADGPARRLRLSYSPPMDALVRMLFASWVALESLERLSVA